MAEVRRLPVLGVLAAALVAGAVLAQSGVATTAGVASAVQAPSQARSVALSSSWFCAGATSGAGSLASGQLIFDNAGPTPVRGSVRLISQSGQDRDLSVTVPAGASSTLAEQLRRRAGSAAGETSRWVGALVTLYGGMASVSQEVVTAQGSAGEPCASAAATRWYFATGMTLRNAADEISLLNPYPVDSIADVSFSTEYGAEKPPVYQGVVVPAGGLTVLHLATHLRRRQHIAVTVAARTGELVAFQTQIVTPPPPAAAPVGTRGAPNPVVPVAGVVLTLGSTLSSTSWWWPEGADGPGLTESYDVYNPGTTTARLSLSLVPGGGHGLGSSSGVEVGPKGTAVITTNGEPWALPGISYATHLTSTNGVPVVAERWVEAEHPSPDHGLAALLGQAQPARRWLLGAAPGPAVQPPLSQVWLEVVDPGRTPAVVSVEGVSNGRLVPATGARTLDVGAGQRAGLQLPAAIVDQPLVVSSSRPVLVEEDAYATRPAVGLNLSPAVVLSSQ